MTTKTKPAAAMPVRTASPRVARTASRPVALPEGAINPATGALLTWDDLLLRSKELSANADRLLERAFKR